MARTRNDFVLGSDTETRNDFGCTFRKVRESMGFGQAEAAAVLGLTERTVQYWESGSVIPPDLTAMGAINRLRDSKRPPGPAKREALKKSHHLFWEEQRGWTLRFTLERDRKMIGQRMKFRLKTHRLDEAIERRDLIVGMIRKFGLKISDRRQRRKANDQIHP